jgi:hypothetical protein
MKRLLLILALVAAPLMAQEQKKEEAPKEPMVQKLFVLKYADPNRVSDIVRLFSGGPALANPEMHVIAVSAKADAMNAIEDAIKRLDVPSSAPQNIEFTAYLLVGSQSEATAGTVPKDLEPVVTQLKNSVSYRSYRLLDTLQVRARTGQPAGTRSQGGEIKVEGIAAPQRVTTSLSLRSSSLGSDGAIHMERLELGAGVSGGPPSGIYQIGTDLDVKEGQKVVVGKTGLNPSEAIFLVLTARVVQ